MISRYEETIWTFSTRNFCIEFAVSDDFDLNLSWGDDGTVKEGLANGKFIAFNAHVKVVHLPTGATVGEDYLGGCIYESASDFMDHRQCGTQNRAYTERGDKTLDAGAARRRRAVARDHNAEMRI